MYLSYISSNYLFELKVQIPNETLFLQKNSQYAVLESVRHASFDGSSFLVAHQHLILK